MPREVGGRLSFVNDPVSSIVVGSLLGDAYVYRNGTLQIEHALSQRAYVEWKYRQLASAAGKPPKEVERVDRRNGKHYWSLRFYTRALFREQQKDFYVEGIKRVPPQIADWLDPLALAVWFMDDGGRSGQKRQSMIWNVASFNSEDHDRLQKALLNLYGLETTIQRAGKGIHLYVRSVSARRFMEIIHPYIIPSMLYKLPLDPVTTEMKIEATLTP